MSASLFRRRRRSSKVRFTPPNPSEAQQWLGGAEEDKPLFSPFKYMPDKLGVESAPVVVDVAQADRAVGYFKNDFVDCGLTYEPQNSAIVGCCYIVPVSIHTGTIISKENLFKIGVTIGGVFRILIGAGIPYATTVSESYPYVANNLYMIEWKFDYSITGNTSYFKVNGITVWSSTNIFPFVSSDRKLVIGSYQGTGGSIVSEKFDGVIYDVSISNGVDSSLWKLDEEIGNIAYDSIGTMNGAISEGLPVSFHDKGIATTKGAYGLHDLTQQVVPVAIADRAVGNFDGWDTIVSTQLPDSFLNGRILELEGEYRITAIDNVRILWNLTLSTDNIRITYDIYHNAVSGTLNYFYRGVDNVSRMASICNWDGVGNVRAEISPTILQVYVNGTASPPVTTDDISSANFDFDTIFVGGRGPAQNASIIGQHWDFKINGRLIPINETSGAGIFDSDGALFGTLIDAIPESFRSKGIATKYNLNRHGRVTTAGFPGDEWLTPKEFAALHNNTTIFTSDSGLSVLRSLPYDDINTLDAGQIAKINRYMGR